MRSPRVAQPVIHELVLAGGGHSHVAVIRHFAMRPVPGLRLTVVGRDVHTPYSGMLPGLVAGHYAIQDSHIDLRALCEASGARFVHATVCGIDRAQRRVRLEDRPPLRYDWLSLDTGSVPALDSVPGALQHGIAVKPIDRFLAHWQALLDELGNAPRALTIAVIGGGAAGVEVVLACQYRLRSTLGQAAADGCRFVLIDAAPQLLREHNPRVRRCFARLLAQRSIELRLGHAVTRAEPGLLHLEDGSTVAADRIVWAIHAGAPAWPRASGFACDDDGFVRVEATLRIVGEERVFAAGDIAALPQPVAKSGVYAVREGHVLARNLERSVRGERLRAYRPQRRFLALLTTGERHAVASRGALFAAGEWVWRWKDRIDRRFMAMYQHRALAPSRAQTETPMRCGGCAAKVDGETLAAALREIEPGQHAGVLHGLRSADDSAVIAPPPGMLLVQSVDYFRAFVDDPWLLGRIATVHALGDLHAMGAQPHSVLALATVPYAAPAVMQETLAQLMRGAVATLEAEGVALIGGHSNEGADLAFGLSVNGFIEEASLLLKSGMRAGDALVLTKPLGTGVLLAANAAGAAEGRWIDDALKSMQQSNAAALPVLRAHGVRACTDVTGFGLLGHLREMLRENSCGVRLLAQSLPVLDGARQCLELGWRSSLDGGNAAALRGLERSRGDVIDALLVDPQTAGGLLAAVPHELAEACLVALRGAGYTQAAIVGRAETALSTRVLLD